VTCGNKGSGACVQMDLFYGEINISSRNLDRMVS